MILTKNLLKLFIKCLILYFNKERKNFNILHMYFIKFNKNKKYKSQFNLTKVKLCCKIKNIYAHSKFHYKK
jgi:hypothetical protein